LLVPSMKAGLKFRIDSSFSECISARPCATRSRSGGRGRLELEPARRVHRLIVLRDPLLDSPPLNYSLLRGRAAAA
jgi:hypothetical protein